MFLDTFTPLNRRTKMNRLTTTAALLAISGLAASSHAAVITPVSAVDNGNEISSTRDADSLVDSSGLTGGGDILTQTHQFADPAPNDSYYLSNTSGVGNIEFIFDLGAAYNVNGIYVWNYTNSSTGSGQNRAISNFDLQFSTDGGLNYTTTVASGTFANFTKPAAGGVNTSVESRTFSTVNGVTHIKINGITNYGDSRLGVSEIRFEGVVPEPGSLALLGLGGLLVASRRRRG